MYYEGTLMVYSALYGYTTNAYNQPAETARGDGSFAW